MSDYKVSEKFYDLKWPFDGLSRSKYVSYEWYMADRDLPRSSSHGEIVIKGYSARVVKKLHWQVLRLDEDESLAL